MRRNPRGRLDAKARTEASGSHNFPHSAPLPPPTRGNFSVADGHQPLWTGRWIIIKECRGALLPPGQPAMRGWRNTVELVLFEISNSMKPYPSVFHAYTSNMGPVIVFLSQEISMRFPTAFRKPLKQGRARDLPGRRRLRRARTKSKGRRLPRPVPAPSRRAPPGHPLWGGFFSFGGWGVER